MSSGEERNRDEGQRNDDGEVEVEASQVNDKGNPPPPLLASEGTKNESSLKTVEVRFCHAFDHGESESITDVCHGHHPKDVKYEAAFESDCSYSNLESVANNRNNLSFPDANDLDDDDIEENGDEESATESEFFDCVEAEGDGHNFSALRLAAEEAQSLRTPSKQTGNSPRAIFANSFPAVHKSKQKNFVVDYAHLRRSGYFLEKQNVLIPKEVPVGLITSNIKMTVPQNDYMLHVKEWVENLPDDAPFLEDSDDDLMGQDEICEMTRCDLLSKHMTDEDHFKNMILEYGDVVKYTSKPVKPLATAEVEAVLEAATEAVDEYLEKLHKDESHSEPEYVCGKVAFPSSWDTDNDSPSKNSDSTKKSSWFRSWLPLQGDVGEKESCHDRMEQGTLPDEQEQLDKAQIVLEPYHGPVFINGAVIEAGSTHPVMINKGMFASIVEEIKAVLQAIHRALRRTDFPAQPPPVSPASSFYQSTPINEDPEIKQLTEMLQDRQQNTKKSTERTVFGLRNLDKSPRYNLAFRRRLRLAQPRHGNSRRFFRALNGWIQRDARTPYINDQFRTVRRRLDFNEDNNSNYHISRIRAPQRPAAEENLPLRPRPDFPPPKSSFLASTVAHFVSAMKSMVPFQITPALSPAIPASLAPGIQESPPRYRSSPRPGPDLYPRRNLHGSSPIPTRYQAVKDSSTRQLRRHRNL